MILEKKIDIVEPLVEEPSIISLGVLAGFAATTADFAVYPFNNIQVRMQMNGTQGLPNYTSFLDCVSKTVRTQGVRWWH